MQLMQTCPLQMTHIQMMGSGQFIQRLSTGKNLLQTEPLALHWQQT